MVSDLVIVSMAKHIVPVVRVRDRNACFLCQTQMRNPRAQYRTVWNDSRLEKKKKHRQHFPSLIYEINSKRIYVHFKL